jgi:hypothetical protein
MTEAQPSEPPARPDALSQAISDDRAAQIVRNCHRAMPSNGRLILVDYVLRPGGEPDFGKFVDLVMLALNAGGRERTEAEFRELFATAGFELTQIVRTATPKSVIEGVRR